MESVRRGDCVECDDADVENKRGEKPNPRGEKLLRLSLFSSLGAGVTPALDGCESVGYDRAMAIKRVCVYCASSRQCDAAYHDAAARLGRELARNQVTLVYGGGSVGSMGHLADAALAEGGRAIGILPQFMYDLEGAIAD
jgi:hypothetical protein